MSRLDDLYKAIETMRREHLSTADLEAKVSLAEEEIIKMVSSMVDKEVIKEDSRSNCYYLLK